MTGEDYIEIGETGMVPQANGMFLHVASGNLIDAEGRVFTQDGILIEDPTEDNDEE